MKVVLPSHCTWITGINTHDVNYKVFYLLLGKNFTGCALENPFTIMQ